VWLFKEAEICATEQWQQWHKDVPLTNQRMDKDVPLCPGRTGGKNAPAFSTLPTSMWVVFRKEPWMAVRLTNQRMDKTVLSY
jgi:hypothetical protein